MGSNYFYNNFHFSSLMSIYWNFPKSTWPVMTSLLWWQVEFMLMYYCVLKFVLISNTVNINSYNPLKKGLRTIAIGKLMTEKFVEYLLWTGSGNIKFKQTQFLLQGTCYLVGEDKQLQCDEPSETSTEILCLLRRGTFI